MIKTIFHYGGWSRNYGDLSIQHGMMNQLIKLSKVPLNFIPIDLKQGTAITLDDINYMNLHGNMLIVGGGGMIMKGDGFDTISGWQFNIDVELIKRIKIPIVVYAIGLNEFPHDSGLPERAYVHLRETMDRAKLISVRNSGTKKFLQNIGIFKKIRVIPDPAMFADSYEISLPFSHKEYLIGINWAGDRYGKRFKDTKKSDQVKKIIDACMRLLKAKGGGKIVWIPHVSLYDLKTASDFKNIIGEGVFFDISGYYPHLYPEQYFYVPQIVGMYRKMDMVIAMRGHGNILSFAQGTRCIAYGDHKKIEFFTDEVNLPCLKSSCTEDELFNAMSILSDNKDYAKDTNQRFLNLHKESLEFNKKLLNLIGC